MNYLSNIDTLIFLLDIEKYEEKCKELIKYLKEEKQKALIVFEENHNTNYTINLNGMSFSISHTGTKGYAFILQNSLYNICISEYKSKIAGFKPIKIRISSEALWSIGLLQAYNDIINWVRKTFYNITQETVYRIDLCCHCNIDFITDYKISYKGNFKHSQVFSTGNDINAICFGSRNNKLIYCRIYNKSLELQEKKQKTWFREIWKNSHLDINNVWNLEFEIKSDFLRNVNLLTVNDIYTNLQSLWRYCTEEWLVKVIPNKTRISRCDICPNWQKIQEVFNEYEFTSHISKKTIDYENSQSYVPTIAGYITSFSANRHQTDINKAIPLLQKEIARYFKMKDTSFDEVVNNKIRTKGELKNDKVSDS